MAWTGLIGALVDLASTETESRRFRRGALDRMGRVFGYDSAMYLSYPDDERATGLNKEAFIHLHKQLLDDRRRYDPSLAKGRVVLTARSAYLDTEVYTAAERRNLPFFAEIVRPQNITSQLVASVDLHGRRIGTLYLCRHGRVRPFGQRHLDNIRPVVRALAVAHAAVEGTTRGQAGTLCDGGVLTRREREVARAVCRGLRNRDIALLLGTSSATVRNQLQRMFTKLGVASRTELASLLLCGALE